MMAISEENIGKEVGSKFLAVMVLNYVCQAQPQSAIIPYPESMTSIEGIIPPI
jgi:hypothetical protein